MEYYFTGAIISVLTGMFLSISCKIVRYLCVVSTRILSDDKIRD